MDSEQRQRNDADAAHAVFAAVAQIGLALRESEPAVAEMGALFDRLSTIPAAQAEAFKGVQCLQFYDRLVQHLTHLEDYLIAVANELDSCKPQAQSEQFWSALHAKLRTRLISDEQRGLLDLYLRPDLATRISAKAPAADYSAPGSSELF
jgi:hypothetical protein